VTYAYDRTSKCAEMLKSSLIELNANHKGPNKLRVNILICSVSELAFMKGDGNQHKFKIPNIKELAGGLFSKTSLSESPPTEYDLPKKEALPNLEFHVKSFMTWLVGDVHDKMVIVDGKTLVIGSRNLDTFKGYDYWTQVEGPIALSARKDFFRLWREDEPAVPTGAGEKVPGAVPMVYLSRREDGNWLAEDLDNTQDQAFLKALEVAKDHVYIQTPNFQTRAMADKVIETVKRGVRVTIITSFSYQVLTSKFYQGSAGNDYDTMKYMYKALSAEEAARLNECWFIGKKIKTGAPNKDDMSHVKFMAIDDELIIVGSSNQDAQTWYHSNESDLLIDDPVVTKHVLAKLLRDQFTLDHCYRDHHGKKETKIQIPPWKVKFWLDKSQ